MDAHLKYAAGMADVSEIGTRLVMTVRHRTLHRKECGYVAIAAVVVPWLDSERFTDQDVWNFRQEPDLASLPCSYCLRPQSVR